jgi:hypothetical protein
MKNKFFLWLSLLITLSIVLYSCRNEDFAKAETDPQRNNANFFKHQSDIYSKAGVDYINILEAYNKETDFLSTMPDQRGIPIWDKMQIVDAEGATGLMIPLSYDNETLSSILFANLDEKNLVLNVKNYDNSILKKLVYNTEIDIKARTQMFYTFMYVDHQTFGTESFTCIPYDMFDGDQHQENSNTYGRVWLNDFKSPSNPHYDTSKMTIMVDICVTSWHCKEGKSWKNCDKCGTCLSYSCTTIGSGTFDDPIYSPGTGTSPGSGGGGGGSPSPEGIPPVDPCTQSGMPFYRIAPGCGGNVNPNLPELDTPCQKIITENLNAKALLNQTEISTQNGIMTTGISTSTVEKAFIFGKNPVGQYKASNIILGASSGAQVSLPPTDPNFTAEGGIHNHTNAVYEVPSPGDIYWFMQNNYQNSNFDYYFVNGALGSTYAFLITNQADFDSFPLTKPPSQYFDSTTQSWNITKDIGVDFENVYKYFRRIEGKTEEESTELATAFVISKYNMGMGLSKKDTNGNFNPIFVKEVEQQISTGDPSNPIITIKTYQKTSDCNLK